LSISNSKFKTSPEPDAARSLAVDTIGS